MYIVYSIYRLSKFNTLTRLMTVLINLLYAFHICPILSSFYSVVFEFHSFFYVNE